MDVSHTASYIFCQTSLKEHPSWCFPWTLGIFLLALLYWTPILTILSTRTIYQPECHSSRSVLTQNITSLLLPSSPLARQSSDCFCTGVSLELCFNPSLPSEYLWEELSQSNLIVEQMYVTNPISVKHLRKRGGLEQWGGRHTAYLLFCGISYTPSTPSIIMSTEFQILCLSSLIYIQSPMREKATKVEVANEKEIGVNN